MLLLCEQTAALISPDSPGEAFLTHWPSGGAVVCCRADMEQGRKFQATDLGYYQCNFLTPAWKEWLLPFHCNLTERGCAFKGGQTPTSHPLTVSLPYLCDKSSKKYRLCWTAEYSPGGLQPLNYSQVTSPSSDKKSDKVRTWMLLSPFLQCHPQDSVQYPARMDTAQDWNYSHPGNIFLKYLAPLLPSSLSNGQGWGKNISQLIFCCGREDAFPSSSLLLFIGAQTNGWALGSNLEVQQCSGSPADWTQLFVRLPHWINCLSFPSHAAILSLNHY